MMGGQMSATGEKKATSHRFGLIGHPVNHSFSADLFNYKFQALGLKNCSYGLYDLPKMSGFSELLASRQDWVGFNVTVPHKVEIMSVLDDLSEEARAIGAVNTLVRCKDDAGAKSGKEAIGSCWRGHNTDAQGFQKSIAPFLEGRHERALVLGSGGSSRAVVYALDKLGIAATVVSRNVGQESAAAGQCTYSDLTPDVLAHFPLIVNCTPVGMWPKVEAMVDLPLDGVSEQHLVVDLVYNPEQTKLMLEARSRGATVLGGRSMLHLQAEAAWELWKPGLNLGA
jgi:shikimate dehydrogenase